MVLRMQTASGKVTTATAAAARLDTDAQVLTADTTLSLSDTDGLSGTMDGVVADVLNELVTASGSVDVTMGDGTRIKAGSLRYDGAARFWTFERVTLVIPARPKGE
jgi:hypothetical protein